MSSPEFIIPPRQPNESAYQYRVRRTMARYGQTPYQRRIFLAQQRGIGRTAARGHAPRGGQSEYQLRRQRYLVTTGVIPSVLTQAYAQNWLITHGFTPETTGASWTYLYRMEPSLRGVWERTSPDAHISPEMLAEAIELEASGELPPGWTQQRTSDRLTATIAYQDFRDRDPGRYDWNTTKFFVPSEVDIKWWYYH